MVQLQLQLEQPKPPTLNLVGLVFDIPLTQGQFAIVDAADHDFLMQWKWFAQWHDRTQSFYARRAIRLSSPRRLEVINMHRLLLGLHKGDMRQSDHRNGNTLDNRRENLRIADSFQNAWNHRVQSSNTSGYKGVSFCARTSKWRAQIQVRGTKKYLGSFPEKEEAYLVYCEAAKQMHGEFARFA